MCSIIKGLKRLAASPVCKQSAAIERPNQTSLFGFGHWWRQWYKERPGYNTPFCPRSSLFLVDSV